MCSTKKVSVISSLTKARLLLSESLKDILFNSRELNALNVPIPFFLLSIDIRL